MRDQLASRKDIARYVHDTASQSILAVALSLARLRRNPVFASAPGFARAVELCDLCSRDLRVLSDVLSFPVSCAGDSEGSDDPVSALQWYVQTLKEDSGLNVTFEATGGMPEDFVALGEVARALICAAIHRWAESAINLPSSDRTLSTATRICLTRSHHGVELQFSSDRPGDPSVAALQSSSLFQGRLRAIGGSRETGLAHGGSSVSLVLVEADLVEAGLVEADSDTSLQGTPA